MDAMEFFELLSALQTASCDMEELDKLEDMLIKEDIPYIRQGSHLVYYGKEIPVRKRTQGLGMGSICSVIAHGYGSEEGLLEIQGLMTDEEYEKTGRSVLGYLSAENVFERIKNHYNSVK